MNVAAVDGMDLSIGMLKTIEMALSSEFFFGRSPDALALRTTLEQAIKVLEPIRDDMNEAMAVRPRVEPVEPKPAAARSAQAKRCPAASARGKRRPAGKTKRAA